MIVVALGLGVLAALVWFGRHPGQRQPPIRIACAIIACVAVAGAIFSGLRGQWLGAACLVALSVWLAQAAGSPAEGGSRASGGSMNETEARAMLGVAPDAGRTEIESAYRRLIRQAHPDHGGSSGAAARLNAARDRLLKRGYQAGP
jgi:hypothetical protein